MNSTAVYGNPHFNIASLPNLQHRSLVRLHFEGFWSWNMSNFCFSSSVSFKNPSSKRMFLVKASASASSFPPLSGSGAEYSEQLSGATPNQKVQRIAGIDQEEIEDPTLLADPDSCFCEFNGVQIHHKLCDSESPALQTLDGGTTGFTERVGFPLILLHGFGSSVFSWNPAMKPLAQITGSKVLAFDRPAFGLTSRLSPNNKDGTPLNPYSVMFSVLATVFFINFLAAEKAILVGHSAGSLVAIDTYFEAPNRVAALILVAPSFVPPFFTRNVTKDDQAGIDNHMKGKGSNPSTPVSVFLIFRNTLLKFTKHIADTIVSIIKGVGVVVNTMYKKAVSAILRSSVGLTLIRMIIDKFGIAAIRNAWYDSNQVSDNVIRGYTTALRIKGWDKALVEYTVAMLTDTPSNKKSPPAERLKDISCPVLPAEAFGKTLTKTLNFSAGELQPNCLIIVTGSLVLIITGDTDRLVPAWNSRRLSQAIPGSCLEIIKNCGHLPQEEKAEEFVSIVDKFLRRAFGTAQEESVLQVVT
ncbi:hypothetical protein F511_32504 [Dorcoceras hygrometricum]|uniref:AB hydrolase-1 domain-containing protein n=1 Tax=Dorcoceras hygrometricum TaxID=472368 RepID=A0A2Z7BLS6_9LAMI|nr:hypothetical protein F511_32504 [Dorcoceras hygrometricum]